MCSFIHYFAKLQKNCESYKTDTSKIDHTSRIPEAHLPTLCIKGVLRRIGNRKKADSAAENQPLSPAFIYSICDCQIAIKLQYLVLSHGGTARSGRWSGMIAVALALYLRNIIPAAETVEGIGQCQHCVASQVVDAAVNYRACIDGT